jgi:hypothetical protein
MNISRFHAICPLSLSDFSHIAICQRILVETEKMKFAKNVSNGSRTVDCGQTDRHKEVNSCCLTALQRRRVVEELSEGERTK